MFIKILPHFILGEGTLVAQKLPRGGNLRIPSFGLSAPIIHKNHSFIMVLICLPFLISSCKRHFCIQHPPVFLASASSSPLNQLLFSLQGHSIESTVPRVGLPEHAPVLLMPHLDPFLPLVLVKLVLLQDPGKMMWGQLHQKQTEITAGDIN